MTYKLKISSQNQVTLPVDLMKQLGFSSGMYLYLDKNNDDFVIQNVRKKVAKVYDSLGKKVHKSKLLKTGEDFEQAIESAKIENFRNNKV